MKEKMEESTFKASITSDMFNYSFKPEMEKKLRLFADHGFQYIHWCDDWNNDVLYTQQNIELYSQLIESTGLKCIDVHGVATRTICICADGREERDKYTQLLKNRIVFCSATGGDAVVIHPPNVEGGSERFGRNLENSLEILDKVRPLCEDLGIALAVENCFPSDEKILECYFDRYRPEFISFCFDSGHANVNRNLDHVLRFGCRLKALHLHDNRGEKDDHQPPFWGTIAWREVMRWIKDCGYGKPVNFEITHNPELFKSTMEEFLDYSTRSIRKALALIEA
jgi:sugar phosphate isomerase/epimerase